jgi:uncharacterized repeat protein (TIGR01451 family)
MNIENQRTRYQYWSLIFLALAVGLALTMAIGFTIRSQAAEESFAPSYIVASQPTLAAGEKLTYSIHVINNSATPALANVSDKVPAELAYVSGSANLGGVYFPASTLLTWDNVNVPASAEVVLTFQVTPAIVVSVTLDVMNKASIQVVAEDGLGEISTRAVTISLVPGEPPQPPVVNAFKTASQQTLAPGEKLTFTIQIINSSAEAITANVSDPLPADLKFVEGTQSAGGVYDPAARLLTWRAVQVDPLAEVNLTFDVQTVVDTVTTPFDVTNVAEVTFDDQVLKPEAKITIVATPQRNSVTRPEVTQVVIGDRDVITDPNVVLHITASADAKWMFVREYSVKNIFGLPFWGVDHSSGWIPFEADHPWTLGSASGVHYVAVKVANEDLSGSLMTHQAMDFVTLNPANTKTEKPGLVPYQVYYGANVDVTIELAPVSGNADLYVWYPGNFVTPDQTSLQPGTAVDKVTFNTGDKPGIYLILVHALEPVTYNLVIQPAGGPSAIVTGIPAVSGNSPVQTGAFAFEPVFTNNGTGIGIDPLGSAQEIGGLYRVHLPTVQR